MNVKTANGQIFQEHVSSSLETFAASNITACLPFLWSCSTLCSIYGLKTYDWYVRFALSLSIIKQLEMWANAQRDGRPAEYRWRPLFNAAKCGWCPVLECRAVRLASGARMANFGRFLGSAFPASRMQHISGLHSKFALGPHHVCRSMVDIQSATAEIRRGKKERTKEKETGQKYNVRICYTGRP